MFNYGVEKPVPATTSIYKILVYEIIDWVLYCRFDYYAPVLGFIIIKGPEL